MIYAGHAEFIPKHNRAIENASYRSRGGFVNQISFRYDVPTGLDRDTL